MRTLLIRSVLMAGLLALTGCGGTAGGSVDSGTAGLDAPPGNLPDGKTTGMGGDGGAMDGPSVDSPDVPLPDAGGADAGGRDWVGGDRAYLPARSPDGSVPECIWTLLRQCCGAPGDRCIGMTGDGGDSHATCWPTGERQISDSDSLSVYSSDGTLCFTDQPKPSINGHAFYDGAGREIASYTFVGDGTWNISVSCDGATFRASFPLNCATALGVGGKCFAGYCPL